MTKGHTVINEAALEKEISKQLLRNKEELDTILQWKLADESTALSTTETRESSPSPNRLIIEKRAFSDSSPSRPRTRRSSTQSPKKPASTNPFPLSPSTRRRSQSPKKRQNKSNNNNDNDERVKRPVAGRRRGLRGQDDMDCDV